MKTTLLTAVLAVVLAAPSSAQLKSHSTEERSASASLVRPSGAGSWGGGFSSFFGLLDPDRFLMRHTLSYNYMTAGGAGLSVASYTNSMFYSIADPLNVRFDVTLQGSPFGPTAGAGRGDLSRLYLSRAELNYRPSDNLFLQLQYRELPYTLYRGYFDPWYYSPWGDR
jgi:hypothetical protein